MNRLLECFEHERTYDPNDPIWKEICKSLILGYTVKFKVNGKPVALRLVNGEIIEY